jgi:hypothetical protein
MHSTLSPIALFFSLSFSLSLSLSLTRVFSPNRLSHINSSQVNQEVVASVPPLGPYMLPGSSRAFVAPAAAMTFESGQAGTITHLRILLQYQ